MSLEMAKDYEKLLAEIKERVRLAQYEALRKVNKELIGLYWDIGSAAERAWLGEVCR